MATLACVDFKQVSVLVVAVLAATCCTAARRPAAPPGLSWIDGPGSAGSRGSAGGYDNDLDVDEVAQLDPPSADKRTSSLRDICDNIDDNRGVLLRTVSAQPCPCELGYGPLHLGNAHYPRHLNVMQCLQSARCLTRSFRVPLLTRRSAQDSPSDDTLLVPEALRKHWRFELKAVPVACDCVP